MSPRLLTRTFLLAVLILVGLPLQAGAQADHRGAPPLTLTRLGPITSLKGSVLPRLAAARRLATLAPRTGLEIDVALRVRDEAALNRFLEAVYDPRSPLFHHFLSPKEFAARFAPTAADRSVLATWLRHRGLRIVSQSANGLLIRTRASAAIASRAFGTRIDRYIHGQEQFFANAAPVRLPRALAGIVSSVVGMDNAGLMRPAGLHYRVRPHSISHATPRGYSPADLRSAYNMDSLYNNGLSGSGETMAVAEFADFLPQNISTYDQQFGLSATSPQRVQVQYNGQQGKTGGVGQGEAELDIEVVHAIAPAARLLVYVSPEYKGAGLVQANRIVTDNLAKVVSVSWGFPENYIDASFVSSYNQIMREAASQGIAVFVASGDSGAYDAQGWFSSGDSRNNALVIDYPSSDPWVTAVGGTSLDTSNGAYGGESVWSSRADGSGSGGGLSRLFNRPDWQVGPGVANSYSNGRRQTPDVSADADPATGYAIYTYDGHSTGWSEYGGTSASSPLWAAYTVLLQQYLKTTIGFMNPTLYALGQKASTFPNAPYHDVTSGDNLYYSATAGWDYGTGWGSMDGTALLNDIVAMGGPLIDHPSAGGTPIPIPTSTGPGPVAFRVIAHWEKYGAKGNPNAPGITSSRKGTRVQLGLYFQVDSAPGGLAVTASFLVTYKGKKVASASEKGSLDTGDPTGTYAAQKSYKPTRKGMYTFIGKVRMGGQTIARQATLTVK